MPVERPDRLNGDQFGILQKIVAIPSPYTQEEPVGDETQLQNAIWDMLQDCGLRLARQDIADGSSRYNIIAEKGAPIEESQYTVMVYVHTDTIKKKPEWGDAIDYKLKRDGEFLRGVGAYDMKAGVMLLIDLLQSVELPEGVTLVGAFCCGEERDSDGIKKLMEWPYIKHINIVLSPEIGARGNDPKDNSIMLEKDHPKDIIVGRPGNVKSSLVVTAEDSHAYKTHVADAVKAWTTIYNCLDEMLWSRVDGNVRTHPDFGNEFLRFRELATAEAGEYESIATSVRSRCAIRIVPPTTIDEIRAWQQQALKETKIRDKWEEFGLGAEFTRAGMSYNPYIVRTDSSDVQAVGEAAGEHYGDYRFSPGQGVADGAHGHWEMNTQRGLVLPTQFNQYQINAPRQPDEPLPEEYVPWLDIGPLGQGAHKKTERVYEASLVKLIAFYRFYLTQYLPRYLHQHA